jgi:diphosphomevalonate decarboxylase
MSDHDFKGHEFKGGLESPVAVSWRSPSNIALVKYWGKTGRQIPLNPSISMTLSSAVTETMLTAYPLSGNASILLEFYFEGVPNSAFGDRISRFLTSVNDLFPYLSHVRLKLDTLNTFPHSAGIASSASAFSALALCLCSLEEKLSGYKLKDFYKKASYVARLGSGSACRSLYTGITLWGKTLSLEGSSDHFATPVSPVHASFSSLRDAILLVSSKEKKVSSSMGHSRMDKHPFSQARITQANSNISELLLALRDGNRESFIRITENEAMTLHALMMASEPGFILMEPETIRIISRIQLIRQQEGLSICFTLDAGPNVHLLYFEEDSEQVRKLIVEDLLKNDKQKIWIDDKIGIGPEMIS